MANISDATQDFKLNKEKPGEETQRLTLAKEEASNAFTPANAEGYTMQTTADAAHSHFMKRNTKDYNDFSYFISGIDVTEQNLDQLTPYVPGISRLFMHRTPLFMDVAFPQLTRNFKSYVETGYRSVEGIEDLSADFISIDGGFANQSFENISKVTDSSNQLSFELWEQTGSPVREFIELWMTGVRDPRSGVAHYHGYVGVPSSGGDSNIVSSAANAGRSVGTYVPYGEKNHTAEFMYYALDPTAHYIEYAALFAHCFPRSIQKSHLNYTSGSRDGVSMNLQFAATKYESRYINDLAVYYLLKDQLEYNYLNFNPDLKGRYGSAGQSDSDINYNLNLQERTSTADNTTGNR